MYIHIYIQTHTHIYICIICIIYKLCIYMYYKLKAILKVYKKMGKTKKYTFIKSNISLLFT